MPAGTRWTTTSQVRPGGDRPGAPRPYLDQCRRAAGDALVLTKPLGDRGALQRQRSGKLPYRELETVLPVIAALNANAHERACALRCTACTDINRLRDPGHSMEMARAGGVILELDYRSFRCIKRRRDVSQRGDHRQQPGQPEGGGGFWDVKLKLPS